ncbi:MAG: helix-turn-helix transcriptional regulator [Oscillospiraceae bacterium]|nr:helix-turn-helix transcriptional regulator [Oscillospiraceae bacterium]
MESKFSGMTVLLENTRAKLVFPAKRSQDGVQFHKQTAPNQHIHYDVEVHFVQEGTYRLVSPRQEFLLEKDTVCLIPKGYSHQILRTSEHGELFNVLVSPHTRGSGQKAKAVTQLWNNVREVQIFTGQARICQHIRDFFQACQKTGEVNEHIKQSLMTLVFCLVTEQLSIRFPNRSRLSKACKLPYDGAWFDADLENYIMCNYKQKLSREDVAKHLGISVAQLSRVIQRNYGTNYSQLMTRLRMADAEKLLKTDIPITQIAKSLGYTTYNGFAAAFKKHFGTTPEAMRKEGNTQ